MQCTTGDPIASDRSPRGCGSVNPEYGQSFTEPGDRRFSFPGRVKLTGKVDGHHEIPFFCESPDGAQMYKMRAPSFERGRWQSEHDWQRLIRFCRKCQVP